MTERLLVSTQWLAEHMEDPDVRVVDIRGHVLPASEPPPHYFNHRDDYQQGHIPGAVFVDWVHEITDPDSFMHARIAPPERFAAAMQRSGVGPDTQVIAYDDANGMFAARLWWALNYYGHERVAVLDGGWQRWQAEGRPTSADVPQIEPSNFKAVPNAEWIRNTEQIANSLDWDGMVIDVRSPAEYAGEVSRVARKGHIPGAVNVPRKSLLDDKGRLLAVEDLRAKFKAVGIDGERETVTYCNAGVSASFVLLALKAAGLGDHAAVYDGSWKAWAGAGDNPIEG